MATLVLTTIGSAIGNALLPSGLSILGATLSGAAIGGAIGSLAGGFIDSAIAGPQRASGPRLGDIRIQGSTEGAAIPRVRGRARVAGQIIWAANFKEKKSTSTEGGKATSGVEVTEYSYSASFAVALCMGEIGGIGRVWADGGLADLTNATMRIHHGTPDQEPDPLIAAIEGEAPAFRNTAYVVFEDLALEAFGNRVPQLSFEIFAPALDGNTLEALVRGVDIIPSSGEFVYGTTIVTRKTGPGASTPENMMNGQRRANMDVALDQLQAQLPNARSAALVVAWFGDDLRCGECKIKPGVEIASKETRPYAWRAGDVGRASAHLVSHDADGPLFGGTPADRAVIEAIRAMNARGLSVTFYPFILMDVPPGNTKPDPYNPAGMQPAFPWRGRITQHPAAGIAGSPDKTAAAATQVAAFFGTALRTDFSVSGDEVDYHGPAEWSFRRFILHYAHLCAAAGGVDAFLIASELRGITTIRDSASTYPAIAALQALAADVRAILGPSVKISYAADWTEYLGHQPADGSGDVLFHLDPFWADANVDMVAIDWYAPLSDWRDGAGHMDALAGARSIFDRNYLQSNIEGGEAFDWFYASPAARDAQTRTPITDGAHGEPWVFRAKDLRNFWARAHHNRPGGVRSATPTAWVPQSKPIWLTEIGIAAIDKGTNEPNIFFDPKSSESRFPLYSTGARDDRIQRAGLEAFLSYWEAPGRNPASSVDGRKMLDLDRIHIWAWDARPFPDFPLRSDLWRDGRQWERGHWLTGRAGAASIAAIIRELAHESGDVPVETAGVVDVADGYVIDRLMSARDALDPLFSAFAIDAAETGGAMRFTPRGTPPAEVVTPDDLALRADGDFGLPSLTRAQEADLPLRVKTAFLDVFADYRQASAEALRSTAASERVHELPLPMVLSAPFARTMAERVLRSVWAERTSVSLALPPSLLRLDAGDVITLEGGIIAQDLRITRIVDAGVRQIEAVRTDLALYDGIQAGGLPPPGALPPPSFGDVLAHIMDLPMIRDTASPPSPLIAAMADPWPGAVNIFRRLSGGSFSLIAQAGARASLGETTTGFWRGPAGRWDNGNLLWVTLFAGTLSGASEAGVLNGANLAAIRNADGEWEIIQFRNAELVAPQTWKLSGFLRGQRGTEGAMRNPVAAGAPFVLLDDAVIEVPLSLDARGLAFDWRYGPASMAHDADSYTTETRAIYGLGLRPLSPAHVGGWRDGASGAIEVRFVRRTRIGGDSWEGADVPLGEESETYEIDIMAGSSVKRTLSLSSSSASYTASQQIADFGGTPSSPLTVRIFQMSNAFGRGAAAEAQIWF